MAMFKHLLVSLSLLCATSLAADNKKPNVLFIAVDDLRPELGCYGNPVIKTPNFDRLARRGMVFNRAYCQQAVCSPSRTSLMTGKRPDATRVWDLETHFRDALPNAVTVGQFFKNNGYFSQGMGKIFHGGFDDPACWSVPWGTPNADIYAKPENQKQLGNSRKGPAFEAGDVEDDFYTDGKTVRLAAQTISALKMKDQPFFLAVGLSKPHLPFVAPKKYWDLYDPEKIPNTASKFPAGTPAWVNDSDSGEFRAYTNIPPKDKKLEFTPLPEDLARQVRHGYYAAISYTDANLGVLLDTLDREGLADSTVIVLWGDHGWKLGDHQEWGKHTNFEADTRAPLIFSYPGMQNAGKSSNSLAEFVDVYPTLADLCGLPKPATDGISLRPVFDDPSASVKPVAISQYPKTCREAPPAGDGAAGVRKRNVMGYSIRDERWRLTLWRGLGDGKIYATELYDEVNAPAEPENLADKAENKEVIERLSKFLPPPIPADDPNAAKTPKGKKSRVDVGAKNKDEDATAPVIAPAGGTAPEAKSSSKTLEQLAADFKKADADKDGKLTREEFLTLRKKDPLKGEKAFSRLDADKSGDLSEAEFLNGTKKD